MTQKIMYPARNNSPKSSLIEAVSAASTTIRIASTAGLPDAPNLATLGSGDTAEVIIYTGKNETTLTGVTRGAGGTTAKAWPIGTIVARNFTALDQNTIQENITDLASSKAPLASPTFTGSPKAPTATKGTNTTQIATTAFVAAGLADKQNTLTFDNTPTEGSTNPVTSGGVYQAIEDADTSPTATASGDIVTITDGVDAPVAALTAAIEPIQAGSGDPSPENIRPITGWPGMNVMQTGKNMLDAENIPLERLPNASDSLQWGCVLPVKVGKTYTVSTNKTDDKLFLFSKKSDENASSLGALTTNRTFTASTDTIYYIRYASSTSVFRDNLISAETQLELGTEATTYEPFGTTYSISFGDAGTVYGGNQDVTTGALTVDRAFVEFNGSENWSIVNSGTANYYYRVQTSLSVKSGYGNLNKSNMYTVNSIGNTNTNQGFSIQSNGELRIRYGTEMSLADWKSFITSNHLQVLIYIATSQTYQLTPTEVRTILGLNNIWADTGDITSLSYFLESGQGIGQAVDGAKAAAKYDDTMTRSMITDSIEATAIATKTYAAGALIILNGQLLRATTGIGIGGTIEIGSNAEVITLETILTELSA